MRLFYLFWWGLDSNDKILLSGSNLTLGTVCLRGIPDDFAALCLQNLLIVAPTRDKQKYRS